MTKQALKTQLHHFIDTIDDEETLVVLNESFNSIKNDVDILDELSLSQKERLHQSLLQAKNGETFSNAFVKDKIKSWLTK